VVKELAIELDPADLGAVSLKMRLTNGKLSVVIGVSNSSTLAAIENERGAIALKLGANQQPLQDLIIRSQSVPTSQAEGQDATDLKDRNPSNSDSASQQGDNNGGSQTSRKGSSPPGASPSVLSGRALGDLLV
jgi:flagellar hook-length control protein FliK